ncbi:MAG: metal-dependent hydrolase [Candidatus Omnitrophota bacterium]|nr:MAG: metal-dependent hydrolase [Candidatus Omnitrophota bacterium]
MIKKKEVALYPVPGHLAFSLLCHRYFNVELISVIVGGLLPDLIDKPLDDLFHITPYGRYAMHSLTGLAIAGLVAYVLFGKQIGLAYSLGHLAHLIADADFNPWFWPFYDHQFPAGITIVDLVRAPGKILFPSWILLETSILGLVLFLYSKYAEKKTTQAAILIAIAGLSIYRITRVRPEEMAMQP